MVSLLQMLDSTTDIPQRNVVPLWNHDVSTTGQESRCGILMFPQRDNCPVVESWWFHNGTVVPLWNSKKKLRIKQRDCDPLFNLAAAKLFHNGTITHCGNMCLNWKQGHFAAAKCFHNGLLYHCGNISPRPRLKLAVAKCLVLQFSHNGTLYRCGRVWPRRVDALAAARSNNESLYHCGMSGIPQQYHNTVVESWTTTMVQWLVVESRTFHNGTTVPLWKDIDSTTVLYSVVEYPLCTPTFVVVFSYRSSICLIVATVFVRMMYCWNS